MPVTRRARRPLLALAAAAVIALLVMSSGLHAFVGVPPRAAAHVVVRAAEGESRVLVEVTEESVATAAGIVGGTAGFLLGGLWMAVPMLALSSYVTRRPDDDLGVALKGIAKAALETLNFLHMLDQKYAVSMRCAVDKALQAGTFTFHRFVHHSSASGREVLCELERGEAHLSSLVSAEKPESKLEEVQAQSAQHLLSPTEPPQIKEQVHRGTQPSTARRSTSAKPRSGPSFLDFGDLLVSEPLSEHYASKLSPCVDSLCNGGIGILPTGTEPAMVCSLGSKRGIQGLYDLTGPESSIVAPLSIMCCDFHMASSYVDMQSVPRQWFALMRSLLPGPYCFILRATKEMPRAAMENKLHRKLWKHREISLQMPLSGVVQQVVSDLGEPLLASPATAHDSYETWEAERKLNFYVAGGDLELGWSDVAPEHRVPTVIDLTLRHPVLRRQGAGDASLFLGEAEQQ